MTNLRVSSALLAIGSALTAISSVATAVSLLMMAMAAPAHAQTAAPAPPPARVTAIGGDVTEVIYALGRQSKLVAVDATSQFPAEALKEKKNVGYMRQLSTEGVLSTGSDLIVASERAGPPEVIAALKSASIPYVEIKDEMNPHGVAEKVRIIAKVVGAETEGEALARGIEAEFDRLAADRKRIAKPLRALFVLGVQNGRVTIGGKGTSADAILALAGAQNAAGDVQGFKPVTDEALLALAPDAVVMMSRSPGHGDAASELRGLDSVRSTPAGRADRFITMDALYLLGFGPRTPAAARDLMTRLYPELAGTAPAKTSP